MSGRLFLGPNGALQSVSIEVAHCRWGGGADPGRYHVWLLGVHVKDWPTKSFQAVVDDFGNLVRVA